MTRGRTPGLVRAVVLVWALAACHHRAPAGPEALLEDVPSESAALGAEETLTTYADGDDPSRSARALALAIASDLPPGVEAWGHRALWDPDPWVARAGVDALAARAADPKAKAILVEFTAWDAGDPYVRARAAVALAAAGGSDEARAALSAAWQANPTAPWRRAPLAFGALTLGDAAALAPLQADVAGGVLSLELDFVVGLGSTGQTGLTAALDAGARVAEPELALGYAGARLALGDHGGEAAFRDAFASGDEERRLTAIDVLRQIPGPDADALLRKAGAGSALAIAYAELALAARGDGDPDAAVRALASPDREIRALGAALAREIGVGLEKRAAKAAARAVALGLADADAQVRAESARSAGALRLAEDRDALTALLGDASGAVRVEAAGALRLIP